MVYGKYISLRAEESSVSVAWLACSILHCRDLSQMAQIERTEQH